MIITDEMVEKARMAYVQAEPFMSGSWKSGCLRAALEAVAPMLIAIGLRRAAGVAKTHPANCLEDTLVSGLVEELLDRAQELDPK